jgi:aspartokinase-like uncharacterized kinase
VKVGGSLYDHPRLGPGLRAFVGSLAPSPVLLVPGGGAFAEVVRKLDAVHGLGEEAAHWLALRSMAVGGEFLRRITNPSPNPLPEAERGPSPPSLAGKGDGGLGHVHVLDSFEFEPLPHSWSVTSDSIAARAAVVSGAERLILLKSVDIPAGMAWDEAVGKGWVDPHFPRVVAEARFPIEAINFRRRLDDFAPPSTRVL